ncbi:serine hydrolase domain-containing protein [Thalassococcus sp. BH17M4-6]|uniref:serine hydrolase domain-containing protein n=1 Tax=Thalassococcus sp. BH17M4-6 TaxID=3413148 RepID=UPI003BD5077E
MRITSIAPALAALLFLSPDPAVPQGIDGYADTLRNRSGAPGVGIGWIIDGASGINVAGVRARNTDAAIGPQDLWHIGSNAKAMTATLVARLVEAGVLRWDDTIGQSLGDLDPHPDYRDVTLQMLLAHRGGLPANLGPLARRGLSGRLAEREMIADRRSYARSVLEGAPVSRPGTEFLYSNAGYVVAGAMIEAATGQTWETLIEAWVFEPLDIQTAGFGAPGNAQTLSQPRGHGGTFPWSRGAVAPGPDADNIPAMGPAGTVHLSLRDHLRFLNAHLTRRGGFLSAESWEKLQSDVADQGYALGWVVRDDGALAHAGSNTLWFNIALIDRTRGLALVLALNDGALSRVRPASEAVLAAILAQQPD